MAKPPRYDFAAPNRGAAMLRMVEGSLRDIAHDVGAAGGAVVHEWRVGRKLPIDFFRQKLWDAYQIPVTAWDQLVEGAGPPVPPPDAFNAYLANGAPKRRAAAPAMLPSSAAGEPAAPPSAAPPSAAPPSATPPTPPAELGPPPAAEPDPEPELILEPLAGTKAEVESQLMRARAAASLPNISPYAATRLSAEIRALLRLRATLEAQEPVTLDKLAHSVQFRELRDRIVEAVRECPICLDRLIEVLTVPEPAGPSSELHS